MKTYTEPPLREAAESVVEYLAEALVRAKAGENHKVQLLHLRHSVSQAVDVLRAALRGHEPAKEGCPGSPPSA
jgi:hypothetical protein